jgi:hypothetical protein
MCPLFFLRTLECAAHDSLQTRDLTKLGTTKPVACMSQRVAPKAHPDGDMRVDPRISRRAPHLHGWSAISRRAAHPGYV